MVDTNTECHMKAEHGVNTTQRTGSPRVFGRECFIAGSTGEGKTTRAKPALLEGQARAPGCFAGQCDPCFRSVVGFRFPNCRQGVRRRMSQRGELTVKCVTCALRFEHPGDKSRHKCHVLSLRELCGQALAGVCKAR